MAKSKNRQKPKNSNHLQNPQPQTKRNKKSIHWLWIVLPCLLIIAGLIALPRFTVRNTIAENNSVETADAQNNQTRNVDAENSQAQKVSYDESDADERSLDDEPVDPKTWRDLTLEMTANDGGKVEMTLLRPQWWIEEVGAEAGKTIPLEIPEMKLSGTTKVLAIKPLSFSDLRGDGTVTGTFKHTADNILDLQLANEEKPIGVTPSHPFRSADRNDWVSAGELKIGERVVTLDGTTKVVSIKQRSGKEPVYNLEVHGTHTYYVGKIGALVHNQCAAAKLPDFSGNNLSRVKSVLSESGFVERPLSPGSTSPYRTFTHTDGSKVSIDTANQVVKVNGPRTWTADGSKKFTPRFGPHNQPYEP